MRRVAGWGIPAVVAATLLTAGCSPSDGPIDPAPTPTHPSTTSTAPMPTPSPPTGPGTLSAHRFSVNGIKLTAKLPDTTAAFHGHAIDATECGPSSAGIGQTTMGGEDDTSPVILFQSVGHGCPDDQAINGSMPSWDRASQLPDTAHTVRIGIPDATAEQFDVKYTQCTNSCYGATYRITFVTLQDGRTFYVTTANITAKTRAQVLDSITVRN